MELSINPIQTFKSRAYPIKKFVIATPHGRLTVSEASRRDYRKRRFLEKLTKMLCRNYATLTNDPGWLMFNDPSMANECNRYVKHYTKDIQKRLNTNDENITLLLAKDRKNKVQGVCFAYGMDSVPGSGDACYIEALAVNKPYRGHKVGRYMMEAVLNSAKNTFTDAFLTGEILAKGFYERLGFKTLSHSDYSQRTVAQYIARQRFDYPKYIEFFTKPLQENKPRWFVKSAEEIDKEDAKSLAELLKNLV